jgi:hypothetical protein
VRVRRRPVQRFVAALDAAAERHGLDPRLDAARIAKTLDDRRLIASPLPHHDTPTARAWCLAHTHAHTRRPRLAIWLAARDVYLARASEHESAPATAPTVRERGQRTLNRRAY